MTDDLSTLTVGHLIDRTYAKLLGTRARQINLLTNQLAAPTQTNQIDTMAVQFAAGAAQPGTYIEIDDEILEVVSSNSNSSGGTIQVLRAQLGSTGALHAASSVISVNPYFARFHIRQTLQEEIRSWGPQIFQVRTVDITATNFVNGYDMPTLAGAPRTMFLLNVQASPQFIMGQPSSEQWPTVAAKLNLAANVSDFPSGISLEITEPMPIFSMSGFPPGRFHITVAADLDVDTTFNDTDLLSTMGLESQLLDIPVLGAAWRLSDSREMGRMLTESASAQVDLQQYPPGYMQKMGQGWKQERDSRLQDAIERLRTEYPLSRRG